MRRLLASLTTSRRLSFAGHAVDDDTEPEPNRRTTAADFRSTRVEAVVVRGHLG
jgi:hypothetical protein